MGEVAAVVNLRKLLRLLSHPLVYFVLWNTGCLVSDSCFNFSIEHTTFLRTAGGAIPVKGYSILREVGFKQSGIVPQVSLSATSCMGRTMPAERQRDRPVVCRTFGV